MKWRRTVAGVLTLAMGLASGARAQGRSGRKSGQESDRPDRSPFALRYDPERPRSDLIAPAFSFLLPGLDQWWERQYLYGGLYTGVAVGGLAYSAATIQANGLDKKKEEKEADGDDSGADTELDEKDVAVRKSVLGTLIAQGAGGFSTYHAFRTAVRSRKGQGQYDFLNYEESPGDLLLAPFHFGYLGRSSTLIPLAVGAAIMGLTLRGEPPEDYERTAFTSADGFFTGAYSYNAGTHEEAMFRGWLMPVMREYWDSDFWSNATQSVLFAAAHLGSNPTPWPQLILGYHLGYVTQKNSWRLGEAIFIHTWWDVLAFATIFHYRKARTDAGQEIGPAVPLATLWLPPAIWYF